MAVGAGVAVCVGAVVDVGVDVDVAAVAAAVTVDVIVDVAIAVTAKVTAGSALPWDEPLPGIFRTAPGWSCMAAAGANWLAFRRSATLI